MNEKIESGLSEFHKKYKFIWLVQISAMVVLVFIVFGLHYFKIIPPVAILNPEITDKVVLLMIFILIMAIFFLKRSYLIMPKIVEKARSSKKNPDYALYPYLSRSDEKHRLLIQCINSYNSTMMTIWFLANLIVITAFVSFIFVPLIQTFFIYSSVGLYVQAINFPSFKIYKKIYNFIIG